MDKDTNEVINNEVINNEVLVGDTALEESPPDEMTEEYKKWKRDKKAKEELEDLLNGDAFRELIDRSKRAMKERQEWEKAYIEDMIQRDRLNNEKRVNKEDE